MFVVVFVELNRSRMKLILLKMRESITKALAFGLCCVGAVVVVVHRVAYRVH